MQVQSSSFDEILNRKIEIVVHKMVVVHFNTRRVHEQEKMALVVSGRDPSGCGGGTGGLELCE